MELLHKSLSEDFPNIAITLIGPYNDRNLDFIQIDAYNPINKKRIINTYYYTVDKFPFSQYENIKSDLTTLL